MISSNWLRAAALHPDQLDDDAAVLHYAKVGCALLAVRDAERRPAAEKIFAGEYD